MVRYIAKVTDERRDFVQSGHLPVWVLNGYIVSCIYTSISQSLYTANILFTCMNVCHGRAGFAFHPTTPNEFTMATFHVTHHLSIISSTAT